VQNPVVREARQTTTEGFNDNSICQHCGMTTTYAIHLGNKIDLVLSRLGLQAGSVAARGMQPDLATSFSTRGGLGSADASTKLFQNVQSPSHLLFGADESVEIDAQANISDMEVCPHDRIDQARMPMEQESRQNAVIQSSIPRYELRARSRSPKKQRQREASRRGRHSDDGGTTGIQEKQSNSASGERKNLPHPAADYVSGARQHQISPGLPSLQLGFSRP